MDRLIRLVKEENHSLAVLNGGVTTYDGRGVSDLFRLLTDGKQRLRGATVADKVVGKGAAALMISGGVSEVFALTISAPALALLDGAGIKTGYDVLVPNIINRAGTDICPVEKLCKDCRTAAECLPLIEKFVNEKLQGNP